jgi:hypothetical protein
MLPARVLRAVELPRVSPADSTTAVVAGLGLHAGDRYRMAKAMSFPPLHRHSHDGFVIGLPRNFCPPARGSTRIRKILARTRRSDMARFLLLLGSASQSPRPWRL